MRVLGRVQGEHALQVFGDEFTIGMSLNGLKNSGIYFLLVLLALFVGHETFLLGGENITFAALLLLVDLQATEVGIVQVLWYFVVTQIDFGGGADNITLRNATQWAGVQAERTSDQQKARVQRFQQNNALALMTTSQQDQNGTRLQVGANIALVCVEGSLGGTLVHETLGWEVGLGLVKVDGTFTSVLRATDFLYLLDVLLNGFDHWTLGSLQTPLSTAFVHLALGVTQYTAMEVSV